MSWAALLLAVAFVAAPGPANARVRAGAAPLRRQRIAPARQSIDPLAVAASLDVFAVCLTSGMAVATAAAATAPSAPPPLARLLRRGADLLALGADPRTAWSPAGTGADEHGSSLLRLARRSASSGAALASGVAELADQCRHDAATAADTKAGRASVLIAGPLGLCYLPAFVCLGIVPVVAGLAGRVLGSSGFL